MLQLPFQERLAGATTRDVPEGLEFRPVIDPALHAEGAITEEYLVGDTGFGITKAHDYTR